MGTKLALTQVKEKTQLKSFESWEQVSGYLQVQGEKFEYVVTESLDGNSDRRWFSVYKKVDKQLVPYTASGFKKYDSDAWSLLPMAVMALIVPAAAMTTGLALGLSVLGIWAGVFGYLGYRCSRPTPVQFDYIENAQRQIERDKNQFKDRIAYIA